MIYCLIFGIVVQCAMELVVPFAMVCIFVEWLIWKAEFMRPSECRDFCVGAVGLSKAGM